MPTSHAGALPDIAGLIDDVRDESVVVVVERLDGRSQRPVDTVVAWDCEVVPYASGEQERLVGDIDDAARAGMRAQSGERIPDLVLVGSYEFFADQEPRGRSTLPVGDATAFKIRDAVRFDCTGPDVVRQGRGRTLPSVATDAWTTATPGPVIPATATDWACTPGREEFAELVHRIVAEVGRSNGPREVIASVALSTETEADPLDVYLALREINPSPHMFLVKVEDFALVGCSPLPLLSLTGREIVATTDAGTRRRGEDDGEAWIPTAKETDEHRHIVDALRVDVEGISDPGTVTVESTLEPRRFSHVSHLFATVASVLRSDVTPGAALLRLSPHSAVVGYPRDLATTVIRGGEDDDRGLYGGVIALVGSDGALDSAALLRSATFHGRRVTMRSGAGVVADSCAFAEFEECIAKSEAMRSAVATAACRTRRS